MSLSDPPQHMAPIMKTCVRYMIMGNRYKPDTTSDFKFDLVQNNYVSFNNKKFTQNRKFLS